MQSSPNNICIWKQHSGHVQAPSNAEIFINQSNNVTITNNSTGDPNDHTPPAPPVISGDTVDFNAVTLTGTAEANSTIKVFDNSTQLGTATTNANGQWSFTTGVLANGSQSFTATATDLSLNESTPSSPLVVVLNGPINLVNNGNFETNNFNGWTLSGTPHAGQQSLLIQLLNSANSRLAWAPVGSDGTISQSIATTPGQQYTLSFWLRNEGGGPNDFTATWNGQTLLALTNSAAFGYTEYTYTVTATGGTTALQFSARQDPSRWDLDSISLTPVGSQPPPAAGTVSINDVTISEGNSGTKVATFTVTRSGGTAAFDVNFATSDATATVADSDYVAASNTLHFGADENTKTISVTINGDTKVEANETFNVLLSNATNGATISDNQGVGTITNDDSAVIAGTVSINDVTISEGNSGTKVATFTVTRSGGTAAFDVNFATSDATATVADSDYVAASNTLHFGANENTKTISVTINGDTKVEANETFNVLLSNATNGATISDNQGVGTITNDDSAPLAPPVIASFATDSGVLGDGVTNDNTSDPNRDGGGEQYSECVRREADRHRRGER